jgi:iron complex transport system ATP-binding protein
VVLELHVRGLSFAYGGTEVLREVTLPPLRAGEVTALIGPNATGKSTLLRAIAGIQRPTGTVRLEDGGSAGDHRITPDTVMYVPQELPPASSLTVFETVLLACQRGGPLRPTPDTLARVADALTQLGLDALARNPISELSGGQRQLVSLAQARARQPSVLLLDEPTSNLDLRNQMEILELARAAAQAQPAIVVLTIHDLALAARFADRIAVLHAGRVHSCGPPQTVITPAMLGEVYQVDATVHYSPDGDLAVSATRSLTTLEDTIPARP